MRKIYFDDSVNDSINTPQVDTNGVETEEIEYRTVIGALRHELDKPEKERGVLVFRYNGSNYEGVPMIEVGTNKFGFKLIPENKLKIFPLSEIEIIKE